MNPEVVNIEIYRCSVVFLIETTRDEWRKWYKENEAYITEADNHEVLEEYDSDSWGFCVATEGGDYVCMVVDKDNPGLVAHELFHTADAILSDRGYEFNGVDEPVAYLLEYLINEFQALIANEQE